MVEVSLSQKLKNAEAQIVSLESERKYLCTRYRELLGEHIKDGAAADSLRDQNEDLRSENAVIAAELVEARERASLADFGRHELDRANSELLAEVDELRARVAELEASEQRANAQVVALIAEIHGAIEQLEGGSTFSATNAWSVLDEALGEVAPNPSSSSKSSQDEECCPSCGYTSLDAQKHGDHHLCDGEIPSGLGRES